MLLKSAHEAAGRAWCWGNPKYPEPLVRLRGPKIQRLSSQVSRFYKRVYPWLRSAGKSLVFREAQLPTDTGSEPSGVSTELRSSSGAAYLQRFSCCPCLVVFVTKAFPQTSNHWFFVSLKNLFSHFSLLIWYLRSPNLILHVQSLPTFPHYCLNSSPLSKASQ